MDKESLREKYKLLRESLDYDEIDQRSIAIANLSLQLPIWELINYHIFLPIENKKEVNTEFLLHILQGRDKSVIISKAHFDTLEMTHYLLQENTSIKISKFGIPEPESGIEVMPNQIDVVFVPLLAFDSFGNRVGYGKGFYDRFLQQCNSDAIFIGLSLFSSEEKIQANQDDIPLHYCITPTKVLSFN